MAQGRARPAECRPGRCGWRRSTVVVPSSVGRPRASRPAAPARSPAPRWRRSSAAGSGATSTSGTAAGAGPTGEHVAGRAAGPGRDRRARRWSATRGRRARRSRRARPGSCAARAVGAPRRRTSPGVQHERGHGAATRIRPTRAGAGAPVSASMTVPSRPDLEAAEGHLDRGGGRRPGPTQPVRQAERGPVGRARAADADARRARAGRGPGRGRSGPVASTCEAARPSPAAVRSTSTNRTPPRAGAAPAGRGRRPRRRRRCARSAASRRARRAGRRALNSPARPTEPAGTDVRGSARRGHLQPRVAAGQVGEAGREAAKATRHGVRGVRRDHLARGQPGERGDLVEVGAVVAHGDLDRRCAPPVARPADRRRASPTAARPAPPRPGSTSAAVAGHEQHGARGRDDVTRRRRRAAAAARRARSAPRRAPSTLVERRRAPTGRTACSPHGQQVPASRRERRRARPRPRQGRAHRDGHLDRAGGVAVHADRVGRAPRRPCRRRPATAPVGDQPHHPRGDLRRVVQQRAGLRPRAPACPAGV